MKLTSWNVNGLRAIINKNSLEVFHELNADFFCLQETKLRTGQIDLDPSGYYQYRDYAERKSYFGTAISVKELALNAIYGTGIDIHDTGGRLITLGYPDFFSVTRYTPSSQSKLERSDYRLEWGEAFYNYLENSKRQEPVIVCGDLNVMHQTIDLKNRKADQKNAGFAPGERATLSRPSGNGFIDTFRYFYPTQEDVYSWRNYRSNSRKNNAGWWIDYFSTSKNLTPRLADAKIHTDIMDSNHCPVESDLK